MRAGPPPRGSCVRPRDRFGPQTRAAWSVFLQAGGSRALGRCCRTTDGKGGRMSFPRQIGLDSGGPITLPGMSLTGALRPGPKPTAPTTWTGSVLLSWGGPRRGGVGQGLALQAYGVPHLDVVLLEESLVHLQSPVPRPSGVVQGTGGRLARVHVQDAEDPFIRSPERDRQGDQGVLHPERAENRLVDQEQHPRIGAQLLPAHQAPGPLLLGVGHLNRNLHLAAVRLDHQGWLLRMRLALGLAAARRQEKKDGGQRWWE